MTEALKRPDDHVIAMLRPLCLGLGLFLMWNAVAGIGVRPDPAGAWIVGADAFVGGVLFLTGLAAVIWRPPRRLAHPWGFLVVALTTFTSSVTVAFTGAATEAFNMALIPLGAAIVFIATRWLAAALVLVTGAWFGVSRFFGVVDPGMGDFIIEIALILAIAVHWVRRSSYRGLAKAVRDADDARARNERLNDELERFAVTVSHDLQAPLTALRLQSSIARSALRSGDIDRARQAFHAMDDISRETGGFVGDLLQYSRYGKAEPGIMDVDLYAVIGEVDHYIAKPLEQVGGALHLGELPHVRADPVHMQQLFLHLISNSIRYRRMDTPLEVTISASRYHDLCRIVVEDNGLGFDGADLERIFLPFEHGRDEDRYGHGLGLATCRRIVEKNGGRIRAEHRSGPGARFVIELPASDVPFEPAAPAVTTVPAVQVRPIQ